LTNLTCGTTYGFYVKAYKAAVESDASNTAYVKTSDCPPGDFGKTSPVNGAIVQPNSVTLVWSPSSGVVSYEFCYDSLNNNTCDSTWNITASTSATIGNLSNGTIYYWQVRANNASGTTYADDNSWLSFTVQTESLVHISGVRTADGNWNSKTTFSPGDAIQWIIEVENNTGQDAVIQLTYNVTGPAGQLIVYWQGSVTTAPGILWWGLPGIVPENMSGVNLFEGAVTYQSITTKASMNYTVTGQTVFDDKAYIIQYDGWKGVADPNFSGGGYRKASLASETLTYRATIATSSFTLLTYKGPDQGKAQILVDGVVRKTLDLYSTSPGPHSVQIAGLPLIKHNIVVKVLGQKNTLSTGTEVRVDGFLINSITIEENDPAAKYSQWNGKINAQAYNGSYFSSAKAGATVTFQIVGTSFTWITIKGPAYGNAQVVVDGVVVQTVDLYDTSTIWQSKVVISGLSIGTHIVQIKVLGTCNPNASGYTVAVDGFIFTY
jgi:hypothetical protein